MSSSELTQEKNVGAELVSEPFSPAINLEDSSSTDHVSDTMDSTVPSTAVATTTSDHDNTPSSSSTDNIRDDLVSTAVSFLRNSRVQQGNATEQIAFLQKKGLSQAEIDIAFRLAAHNISSNTNNSKTLSPLSYSASAAASTSPAETSSWLSRLHSIVTFVTFTGGLLYIAHRFVRYFVLPTFYSTQPNTTSTTVTHNFDSTNTTMMSASAVTAAAAEQKRLSNVTPADVMEMIQKLKEAVNDLREENRTKLTEIQAILDEHENMLKQNGKVSDSRLNQQLCEIKSLLLGRDNFPKAPIMQPLVNGN